jgi:hypothetical protein
VRKIAALQKVNMYAVTGYPSSPDIRPPTCAYLR